MYMCVYIYIYIYVYFSLSWRRVCQPTPVFLSGESHRQRRLEGYTPWGLKESDTTEVTKCVCIYIDR